jgi:hypothetical protein
MDDLFGGRANLEQLSQQFRQRNQGVKHGCIIAILWLCTICQFQHPMMHPDGNRFTTGWTEVMQTAGFMGIKADLTVPVTIKVVFALFRKEFNRSTKAVALVLFQGIAQGEKIKAGVEQIGFAPQL